MKTAIILFGACLLAGLSVPPAAAASFSYPARHDHAVGSCRGTLVIADDAIRYEAARHAARWPYAEVQELSLLDTGRVRVLTYRDAGKLRLGADRAFTFVVEGDLREAAAMLAAKLDRRLVVGFAQPPQQAIAEFPVKHLRAMGGDEGTLVFGEETASYRSNEKGQSRTWRYADIESISTSDPFNLSLVTNERQNFHYATRRVFNFQLKRALPEDLYNRLWRLVNRTPDLEVFEKLRGEVAAKAEDHIHRGGAGNAEKNAESKPASPAPPPRPLRLGGEPPAPVDAEPGPASQPSIPQSAIRNPQLSDPQLSDPQCSDPQLERMEQILREEGLPPDMLAVAKVESGFNPFALSPKNARGIWQFIPETARRFGLRVDGGVDERTDPEKSTRAAARYLKELYSLFGDWKLALAGYNAGEKRVQAAQARTGSRDFAQLAGLLPHETRNYVPSVLAAWTGGWTGAWRTAAGRGYRVFAPLALRED